MKNIVDLLLDNFGQDRVKTTPDFLENMVGIGMKALTQIPQQYFFLRMN